MNDSAVRVRALATFALATGLASMQPALAAPPASSPGAERARIIEHWTPARIAAAVPRDFVIDERGQGYLKHPDGQLVPYGRTVADGVRPAVPMAKPGSGGGTSSSNLPWTSGGTVQMAAGRIYFEMPANSRRTRWAGYVCSGTVVADGSNGVDTGNGRSVIQTAAHCVYDDAYKAFARNVLFIPNQVASGTPTDRNCSNDVYGCWTPSHGVVDINWTTRTFPDNKQWDYAYYVVNDNSQNYSHLGNGANAPLDQITGGLVISFATPSTGAATHALGYSYSDDPKFMYCTASMTNFDASNWWMPNCGLTGGSSGGPWMQPVNGGNGPLMSVNSWGYTNQPGMAGPKLSGTSARCVFALANSTAVPASLAFGSAGLIYNQTCTSN